MTNASHCHRSTTLTLICEFYQGRITFIASIFTLQVVLLFYQLQRPESFNNGRL